MRMKRHSEMMQDPIEDKQFENLLSDYAAPVDDDGFSARVMAQLPDEQNSAHNTTEISAQLRRTFIGGGAIVGGAIAATQVPALARLLGKVKLPDISASEMSVPVMASVDTSMMTTTYGMAAIAIFVMGALWVSSTFIFGDQM